jgi:cytochrome P450
MAKRMRERRQHPVDDIMSELVTAKIEDGRPLTDHEVISILQQLLVAGNETTTNGIGNGLLMLAEDQALQRTLRREPERIPQFVEECLRLEAPVQGLVRTTTSDTVLAGVAIPKGKTIFLLYASANRDEDKFPNPGCVDLSRKNAADHLAFGSGRHHCVGSELARVEMRVAFERFLHHFGHFELAMPREALQLIPMFTTRGYNEIRLRVRRA